MLLQTFVCELIQPCFKKKKGNIAGREAILASLSTYYTIPNSPLKGLGIAVACPILTQ